MAQWVKLGGTGLLVLLGLFVSASAHGGFWHVFGLVFALLAALLLFRLIGRAFEPPEAQSPLLPVPGTQNGRVLMIGFLSLLGLVLLFVASSAHAGGTYYLSLLAAILAFAYVFALIGALFERR